MAVKSSNKRHQFKSSLLRQLRKDAGFTQQELANRLYISRETLCGLENCNETQIKALTADIEDDWWAACCPKASKSTIDKMREFLATKMGPFKLF